MDSEHRRISVFAIAHRARGALRHAVARTPCLDVAIALGYVEEVDATLLAALDRVRATLAKNVM
jgi:hypothetical protein